VVNKGSTQQNPAGKLCTYVILRCSGCPMTHPTGRNQGLQLDGINNLVGPSLAPNVIDKPDNTSCSSSYKRKTKGQYTKAFCILLYGSPCR
jgi:hypothetical protein